MPACNVVFGRTGCGKTSLRNMLVGEDPEADSMVAKTSEPAVLDITVDSQEVLYVDTAGVLDNRGAGEDLVESRANKVNAIGDLLKHRNLDVARVFYCVASSERLLDEEIDWLADIVQMLGGQKIMQCIAVVLTKVDEGFQKSKFEKNFEENPIVISLKRAFPGCPILTSGYNNVDGVKKHLVPSGTATPFKVEPAEIKRVTTKADLQTQVEQLEKRMEDLKKLLSDAATDKQTIAAQISQFEDEIDSLQERIANASWWCPRGEIHKANQRILTCRRLIKELNANENKSEADKKRFEECKWELLQEIAEAKRDLEEKNKLGGFFRMLLDTGADAAVGAVAKRACRL